MNEDPIRILHLEDDDLDAELIAYTMGYAGLRVTVVRVEERSGFIAALEKGGFELILSDSSLPAFTGSEALELAKRLRPEVPFVFVSGSMGEAFVAESLQRGAREYVLKGALARLGPTVERIVGEIRAKQGPS
jgi:CheY-like chemotaxis protein